MEHRWHGDTAGGSGPILVGATITSFPRVATGLAAVTILLAVMRTVVAFHQLQRWADDRRAALTD